MSMTKDKYMYLREQYKLWIAHDLKVGDTKQLAIDQRELKRIEDIIIKYDLKKRR